MFPPLSKLQAFGKDRRGGVLVYVAMALPVFLGVSGLAVDISVWHAHKRAIQTLADAGAVAGASELSRMTTAANRNTLADAAAREDALASGAKATDQITVNIPPTSGDFVGATNAVEVIVTREVPTMLSRLINPDDTQVSSRSVAFAAEGEFCVFALNNSSPNAFQVSGGASLSLNCGIAVNSDASSPDEALHVTGGGCVDAPLIKVAGDYSAGGCYNNATPYQQTETTENPLAGSFPVPTEASDACNPSSKLTVHNGDVVDLPAGHHCNDITVQSGGTLRLAEGVHVFDKGFTVHGLVEEQSGSAGVMFYLGPDTGSSDVLNFASDAEVHISAMTTGPYAHLLIYVDEAAGGNVQHNITAQASSTFDGLIYMPGQDVSFSGSSGTQSVMLVADEISFTGSADFSNLGSIPYFTNQEDLKPRLSE